MTKSHFQRRLDEAPDHFKTALIDVIDTVGIVKSGLDEQNIPADAHILVELTRLVLDEARKAEQIPG